MTNEMIALRGDPQGHHRRGVTHAAQFLNALGAEGEIGEKAPEHPTVTPRGGDAGPVVTQKRAPFSSSSGWVTWVRCRSCHWPSVTFPTQPVARRFELTWSPKVSAGGSASSSNTRRHGPRVELLASDEASSPAITALPLEPMEDRQ